MQAVKGIDHAMIVVPDIAAAGRLYARLGFDVQPRGDHTHLGTANHLMIFGDDYLELLGVVEPGPLNAAYQGLSAAGGGLATLALKTDSADLAHEAWTAAGLAPEPAIDFGRAVEVAGRTEQAAFRIVRLPAQTRPGVGMFVCQHKTPQFVYRAEWSRHPNTVLGLAGATIVTDAPAKFRDAAEKIFGAGSVREDDGRMLVDSGTTPIRYLTPTAFARVFAGTAVPGPGDCAAALSFKVRDMAVAERCLAEAGAAPIRTADLRLIVPAAAAGNVVLEFVRG